MGKALLVCGDGSFDLDQYGLVLALDTIQKIRLSALGHEVAALLDVVLSSTLNRQVQGAIDAGLHGESGARELFLWAPLALQQIHWRFNKYYQYKKRLLWWLETHRPTELHISSAGEHDLCYAAKGVCRSLDIKLQILDGDYQNWSGSFTSYLVPNDLPEKNDLDPGWFGPLLAIVQNFNKAAVFFQPCGYLQECPGQVKLFTWARSLCFLKTLIEKTKRKLLSPSSSSVDFMPDQLFEQEPVLLNPRFWPSFDAADLVFINSYLLHFFRRYPQSHIQKTAKRLERFFRVTKPQRLITIQDTLTSARLLTFVAKKLGMTVDYLPHGLIWEEYHSQPGSLFSPDRTLAWNESSAAALQSFGVKAVVVSHPMGQHPVVPTVPVPKDLGNAKVLVMLPEWSAVSFQGRMDCLAHDFSLVCAALKTLGAKTVSVKVHAVSQEITELRKQIVLMVASHHHMDVVFVDSRLRSRQVIPDFDLVIIGNTTGIIECMQSKTPFVILNGSVEKSATIGTYPLPMANSEAELVQLLQSFDVASFQKSFERCLESLKQGPHPFDV